jgi:hypothetical protein
MTVYSSEVLGEENQMCYCTEPTTLSHKMGGTATNLSKIFHALAWPG